MTASRLPRFGLAFALNCAVASYSAMQSVVIPLLPEIGSRFDASTADTAWVLSGFLLIGAAFTPVAGKVGDLIGRSKTLVAVLAIFLVGTVLAIFAQTLLLLIVARFIQGLGAASIALSLSIVKSSYPPGRVAGAIGRLSATMAISTGLGLSLAGLLSTYFGFQTVFLVPLLLATAALIMLLPTLASDPAEGGSVSGVNWVAGSLFTFGVLLILLAITQANTWGWLSPLTLGTAALGGALLWLWAHIERSATHPLIDVRILASPNMRRINSASFLVSVYMFAAYAMIPTFAQASPAEGPGLGVDTALAGLLMLPLAAMNFVAGSTAGILTRKIGSRNVLLLGTALCLGNVVFITFFHDNTLELMIACAAHGLSIGFAFASIPTLMMLAVDASEAGVAAGIYSTLRSLGGALGTQIVFALMAIGGAALTMSDFQSALVFLLIVSSAAVVSALLVPRTGRKKRPLQA